MRQVSSANTAEVTMSFFDTFDPRRICTCVGTPLLRIETQLQGFPYPNVGHSTASSTYSPPIRPVGPPPRPDLRKPPEPLACGRLRLRSLASAPPLTMLAPRSEIRG